MHQISIYHNPKCGTSRNTLALIRHLGIEPTIIHYLDTPPDERTLRQLIEQMNITPRELLRSNVPEYQQFNLDNDVSDDDIIKAMLNAPILINRPIVITEKGVRLCRPSEVFLSISPVALQSDFIKEDGEIIRVQGA